MTSDNLIGVIVGGIASLVGIFLLTHTQGATRFARGILARVYGEFWAKRVNPGFMRLVAGLWVLLGALSIVLGLFGGFNARS